jgi:manganese-dependent inorganic pyrophosphatase
VLAVDAEAFGREMFERTSNLSRVPVEEIVARDAKEYDAGTQRLRIAQVETVGEDLSDRQDDLLQALDAMRERERLAIAALMVTDIIAKGTRLYLSGADRFAIERAFGRDADDGVVELPGVMSRKKQVAPRLLGAVG